MYWLNKNLNEEGKLMPKIMAKLLPTSFFLTENAQS